MTDAIPMQHLSDVDVLVWKLSKYVPDAIPVRFRDPTTCSKEGTSLERSKR